jgi:hypothetical protein
MRGFRLIRGAEIRGIVERAMKPLHFAVLSLVLSFAATLGVEFANSVGGKLAGTLGVAIGTLALLHVFRRQLAKLMQWVISGYGSSRPAGTVLYRPLVARSAASYARPRVSATILSYSASALRSIVAGCGSPLPQLRCGEVRVLPRRVSGAAVRRMSATATCRSRVGVLRSTSGAARSSTDRTRVAGSTARPRAQPSL